MCKPGKGMRPEQILRIFGPGMQTARSQYGDIALFA
jgi:hypothetical protein